MLRLLSEARTGECMSPRLECGIWGAIEGRFDSEDCREAFSLDWSLSELSEDIRPGTE